MSLYTLAFTGILPLGSILSGAIADLIGPGSTMALMSLGTLALGLATPLLHVPDLDQIEAPRFSQDQGLGGHPESLEGGPVMIVNTWEIDRGDYLEFVEVMNRVRLVRLSTGAYRWRLYRNVGRPERFTEVFVSESWNEHLSQHRRIDDTSRDLIRRARAFDRSGDPSTSHLLAVDVVHPPDWEDLVEAHEAMHRRDGSIPLQQPGPEPDA